MRKINTFLHLFVFMMFCATFSKAQIFVDASRPDDLGDGLSLATAKKTINAGISAAVAGNIINIATGVYNENVVVNIPLTLTGAGKGITNIAGGGTNGVVIAASGVTIQDLSVGSFTNGINITINASNTSISRVSSSSNTTYGLFSNQSLDGLIIVDSNFDNNSPNNGRGIMLQGSSTTTIFSNIFFINNTFNNNGLVGIDINNNAGIENVNISQNTVQNNGDGGIAVLAGALTPTASLLALVTINNNIVQMGINQRFGIEIKNLVANGNLTGAGSAIIQDNFIEKTGVLLSNDSRDLAGIAIVRRDVTSAATAPNGIIITKNTIRNVRAGDGSCATCAGNIGNGFGIVAGGTNHQITFNVVEGCQVGIQSQGGNENNGIVGNSPSTRGRVNTLFFDRDNSPAGSALIRYNSIKSTVAFVTTLAGVRAVNTVVIDATGNFFNDATGAGTSTTINNTTAIGFSAESYAITAGTTDLTFVFAPNANIAYNPWAAVDLDDNLGVATLQRGVQITAFKTYRATDTGTALASPSIIQQGINIANADPLIKDVLDIRNAPVAVHYPISASIIINKAITLIGNGGALPRPELIMQASPVATRSILIVSSPNVTIDNLHLKVLGSKGVSTTGAHGIFVANHLTPLAYDNLVIQNNFIENITVGAGAVSFFSFGIRLALDGSGVSPGNNQFLIRKNTIFTSIGNAEFGRAIRMQGNFGSITENNLSGYYNFQIALINGGNLNVTDNKFNVIGEAGLEINNPQQNNGVHTISNNIFTKAVVVFAVPASPPLLEIKNNGNAGITSTINITGNTFTDVVDFGIFVGRSSNVNITNNNFTPKTGVLLYNHIYINTKYRETGISTFVTCENISIKANTFNGNAVLGGGGILFANHLSGAGPAFRNIAIGGDAGGEENNFNTNIAKFIALDPQTGLSDAILPATIWILGVTTNLSTRSNTIAVAENFDAEFNKFDVGTGLKLPSAMINAELISLENKISHHIEYQPLGFVKVKAVRVPPNNVFVHVFVTRNSFLTGFTTDARIERGTNAHLIDPTITDGFTINVEEGTYTETAGLIPTTTLNANFEPVGATPVVSPNWRMNGAGKTLTLLGDLTINTQVTFTDGNINTNANRLIFGNSATDPAINPTGNGEKSASRIIGQAQTTRNVGVGALTYLGVDIPAGTDLGNVALLRTTDTNIGVTGIVTTPSGISIACNWLITPQFNVARNGVSFNWLSDLDNLKNPNFFSVWRLDDAPGGIWEKKSADFASLTTPLRNSIAVNVTQFSRWTISDLVNPLPLTWLYVRASLKTNTNIPVVSWATTTEVNTAYFDVERSIDGKNFDKIGVVSAKGSLNQNNINEYSFDDVNAYELAKNVLYYRLRQVDKNEDIFVENIYPNPTNGILNVSLHLKSETKMQVFDTNGKALKTHLIKNNFSQFDLSDLPAGMYYLEFSDEKQTKRYKIVRN